MEFLVLGPLQVFDAGRPVTVSAPRQRALLAVLLANSNRVVSTDRLLDLAWGEEQPDVGALRYQVSKLRDTLETNRESGDGSVVITESPGYVLRVTPGELDALGFESLLSEAELNLSTDPSGALNLLDEALSLWRGDAYADFAYEEFARLEILRLEERRLEAIEARFDALLALGRDRDNVGELQALVAEHPHRERLTGALMLALYRSGRQADALAAFQLLRRELGESLGIEPSRELVDLEERMLLQDESLTVEAAPPAAEFLRGYALRGRIGEGAHGIVWRAAQPGVGREVAIKAIHPDIANRPGFIRRFEMEAQLVASLEHPHIVSLFDFWRDPEGAYLVMPHLRGGDLAHLLLQGPLRTDAAMELIEAIGDALSYAHRRGVVHRDVTPHNVLLDDEGHPYLADFGVAALIGETGSPTSSSPAYLAPEQHEGRGAVPESDVYSLGALAHSVLTGEMAGVGQRSQLTSHLNADVPAAVDDVIARATSEAVAERFLDPADFVAALVGAMNGSGRAIPQAMRAVRNPYKGLRAFGEADSPDFFGRDIAVSELIDATARHRLVAVVGPSGCGKSSLVRAGLVADLRRGALPGSERWLVTDMYPGARPLNELEEALLRVAVERPVDLVERLAEGDVGQILGGVLPGDAELLLIVDQFEELFTLTADGLERRRFLDVLTKLAVDPRSRVRVVVTLRADFYDRPLGYAGFGDLLRRGLVSITVPSLESMEQAVVGPAESVGLSVEPGLERVISQDVADQPGGLPLLEFALTELFQERVGDQLTAAGYQRTGGVLGALGRRAEDLYVGSDDDGRTAIEQVLLRLVTVEEGVEDTRRRIALTELQELGIEPKSLEQVLDDYGSHRLMTFDRDPETRAPTVEVAHEALLARWDRLRSWIDERRDDLVLHRRLAAAVKEWHDSERRQAYLVTGGRLEHFERFAEETDLALTAPEEGFLLASRQAEDEARASRRRRRLGVLAILGSAAVIAAVLAVVAFLAQRDAEDARATAETNEQEALSLAGDLAEEKSTAEELRVTAEAEAAAKTREATINRAQTLAAEARAAIQTDPELAVLLALEAVEVEVDGTPVKEAIDALHYTVISSRVRGGVPGSQSVDIDGSGTLVVTRPFGGVVTVHDLATGEQLTSLPISGDPETEPSELAMAISRDGTLVATGRSDGTIAVWDVATARELSSTNDTQAVWTNAESGSFTLTYGAATTGPIAVDASSEEIGSELAAVAEVGRVTVLGKGTASEPWSVAIEEVDGDYIHRLGANFAEPARVSASVSVAPAEEDFPMTIWTDAESGTFTLTVDGQTTSPIAFDAEAGELETALEALDGMPDLIVDGWGIAEWPWGVTAADGSPAPSPTADAVDLLRTADLVVAGRGHDDPSGDHWKQDGVVEVRFTPDGAAVVSRGNDQTIRVWRLVDGAELLRFDAPIWPGFGMYMAVSPDGRLIASASGEEIHVWDAASGELAHTLPGHDSAFDVSFFPDGESLVVAHGDPDPTRALSIWDLEAETERFVAGGGKWLRSVAVSPDGRFIATADDGGLITVLKASDAGEAVAFSTQGHRSKVLDLEFAATDSILTSVSDTEARVWDLAPAGTSEWMTLPGQREEVPAVAYSPDGALLARWPVQDRLVIVDVATGTEVFAGDYWASDFAYSPDGSKLVVAAGDAPQGAVQVLSATDGTLLRGLAVPGPTEEHSTRSVGFSPDGSFLVAVVDFAVHVWDAASYEKTLEIEVSDPEFEMFAEAAFSPDGERLAVRGTVYNEELEYISDFVSIYDLSGQRLLTCCEHWWEWWRASVEYSPDGKTILTAGVDTETGEGTVKLWDAATGEELDTLTGHPNTAWDAVFSPDGSLIASSSGPDIRVWDARTHDEIVQLNHGDAAVYDVEFSPDGTRLVSTGDTEGLVRVWALNLDDLVQIANERLTRTFTAAECATYDIDPCPALE